MSYNYYFAIASLCIASLTTSESLAATATGSLNVKLTITAECKVAAGGTALLDFGTTGVIDKNIDKTAKISVQCTNGTSFRVGLSAGTTIGGTVAVRKMSGTPATSTVDYLLFLDAGHTKNWGNTDGLDTYTDIANGSVKELTVYGRVPPQTTPAKGDYSDTVAITIYY